MEAARFLFSQHAVDGRPRLGTMLVERGLITEAQLDEALAGQESGERLGAIVLRNGWVSEEELARALADQHGLDFFDLKSSPPNPAASTLLPEKYARRYEALPVQFVGEDTILVVVSDPTNVIASDDLKLALGLEIRLAVAAGTDIRTALDRIHGDGSDDGRTITTGARQGTFDVRTTVSSAPAIELVNSIIKRGIQEHASDLHFEPYSDRMIVRARIDGVTRRIAEVPSDLQQAVTARLKIMGELDIAERRLPQDGRVSITFGSETMDLRIAVLPTSHGEQVVLRILYGANQVRDLSQLGMATDTSLILLKALQQPHGAVVVCGPTGSGKTSTLYTGLAILNTEDRVLMTIEDPVEIQIDGINQIGVNVRAGLTFAKGLRTILRSDPDVLLVGEIRDSETATIAIQAAMTGHLVLTTVHADNVARAFTRLHDMGVDPSLLQSTVNCVLSQRLARRLCFQCREPYLAVEGAVEGFAQELLGRVPAVTLHRPKGCPSCLGTGYRGRAAFYEILDVRGPIRRMIGRISAEELFDLAIAEGMRTLREDGLRLCVEGLTSLEEIRRVAGDHPL